MTAYQQKIIRDFWHERTRTVLVVLAIALGIAAFSAVLSSYAILTRELDQGYLATNPASASLQTDAIDDALLRGLAAHPSVSAAEPRRTVAGRIKVGPAEWRNLMLFVVKDYGNIRVSTLQPQQGAWPPATGEILIERDALQVARSRIGDTLTVKTARSQEQPLRVSGTAKDVGQAQARMENVVYGYLTQDTLAQLGEEPFLDRLNIVVTGNRFDEAHVRKVATEVKDWVESQGHAVRRLDIPAPGKHPHSDLMGLLLLAMSGFGLLALALSGMLVVNLLMALMSSQIRQIGMMKAIGGTRGQIARIYFAQALLLGVAAVILALPVGLWGSRVLCRSMAVFLNFDINSFAVPLWVYLLVAVIGLVVPLLAAAYPVWKGSGISVREALADFGVGQQAFGTSRFDRTLAGMGGTSRPLLFALRNGFRRRARLALTLLTLAMSGLFFMSALNVRASLIDTLDRLFATKKFDLAVNLGTLQSFEKVERAVRNTPGVLRAEGWITAQGVLPSPSDAPPREGHSSGGGLHRGGGSGGHGAGVAASDSFSVIGLPPDTMMLKPDIIAGRGLLADDKDVVVLNSALAARRPQLKVGNEVVLRIGPAQKTWRVVGIAQEPFSPPTAYVPRRYFEEAGGHVNMANSVRLALEKTDSAFLNSIRASLDRNLEQEGLRALSSATKADGRYGFDQHMLMIYVFLIVVSCILAAVGGLGLMTTMSINVLERRREMGVLRAIGAVPSVVGLIVVAEAVVIGLLSWALAALAAWPVSKALGDLLVQLAFKSGLAFFFELRGLLIWLAVSLGLCAVASFVPAWRASQYSVREAIGHE
jgi:putative ABC transport system permease protein